MRKPNEKDPEAPLDLVAQMFLEQSREYLELVPRFSSVRVYHMFRVPDDNWTRRARRVALLHVALGRKFITRDEPTHIPRMLERILQERGGRLSEEDAAQLSAQLNEVREAIASIRTGPGRVDRGDGSPVSSWAHWQDVMYSGVLHSDVSRWNRRGESAWGAALLHLLSVLPKMRDIVCDVRDTLVLLGRDKILDLGGIDPIPSDGIESDDWTHSGAEAGSASE